MKATPVACQSVAQRHGLFPSGPFSCCLTTGYYGKKPSSRQRDLKTSRNKPPQSSVLQAPRASCRIDTTATLPCVGRRGGYRDESARQAAGHPFRRSRRRMVPVSDLVPVNRCAFACSAAHRTAAGCADVRADGRTPSVPRPRTATRPGESGPALLRKEAPGRSPPYAKHRPSESATPFRYGNGADPGIFGIPTQLAILPSFEYRCCGNGMRKRGPCGADGGI